MSLGSQTGAKRLDYVCWDTDKSERIVIWTFCLLDYVCGDTDKGEGFKVIVWCRYFC